MAAGGCAAPRAAGEEVEGRAAAEKLRKRAAEEEAVGRRAAEMELAWKQAAEAERRRKRAAEQAPPRGPAAPAPGAAAQSPLVGWRGADDELADRLRARRAFEAKSAGGAAEEVAVAQVGSGGHDGAAGAETAAGAAMAPACARECDGSRALEPAVAETAEHCGTDQRDGGAAAPAPGAAAQSPLVGWRGADDELADKLRARRAFEAPRPARAAQAQAAAAAAGARAVQLTPEAAVPSGSAGGDGAAAAGPTVARAGAGGSEPAPTVEPAAEVLAARASTGGGGVVEAAAPAASTGGCGSVGVEHGAEAAAVCKVADGSDASAVPEPVAEAAAAPAGAVPHVGADEGGCAAAAAVEPGTEEAVAPSRAPGCDEAPAAELAAEAAAAHVDRAPASELAAGEAAAAPAGAEARSPAPGPAACSAEAADEAPAATGPPARTSTFAEARKQAALERARAKARELEASRVAAAAAAEGRLAEGSVAAPPAPPGGEPSPPRPAAPEGPTAPVPLRDEVAAAPRGNPFSKVCVDGLDDPEEQAEGAGKGGRRRGKRSEAAIETRRKALQFKHDLRETGNQLRDLAHIEDHPSENSSDAIEEAQKEVLGRITDLERTRQEIAESREAIERMGEQIRGASSTGTAVHGLVDTKGIGKPTTMGDDQEKFGAWNRKMENYVIGVYGESFRPVLRWAAEAERPATIAGAQAAHDGVPELETKVNQLYAALISTTADGSESNDLVTGAPDGNGLEAWRKLHRRWDPTTGPRKRLILRSIISPPKCSADELGSALEKWIQQIGRYERRQGEDGLAELPEDIKMAALEMLVPQDIENHLVLNKHRLETFQDSLNEVMTIVEARTGVKIKAAGSLEEEPEAEVAALDMGSLDCLELASGSGRGVAAVDLSPFAQDDWMKFNWDSGAAISAFPRSFAPPTGMKGNGSTYRTASGELVPDEGSLQLKAEDEYGVLRALKGRVTNVHKPLISVGQAAGAGQCSFLGRNGGWIFHEKSPIGKRVVGMLEKEAKAAKHQMLPVYREQGVYNFYLKKGQHGSVAPLEEGLSAKSKSELVELLSGKSKEELMEILEKTPAAAAAADALPAAPDGQQADEGEEEARPRVLKAPHEPSQREIAEHEAMGHATYRSWCRVCIAAKGQGQPHLRAPEDDETAVPVVSSDYAFMGQDDADTMPMLVLRDRRSKMMAATFVEKKGDDAYAIKFFARFLRILGYRKIVNKSDGEPAILLVKRRAVEEVPGLEAIPQESAPADHQANGEIEVTVREIKKQVRALKMDLESKLGVKVEDKHPVLAHLPEHAASVINRYRRGQDGKTALQRLTGRQWRKPVPLFGERLMARFAGERVRKNALEEQMVEARYIGHHPRDGSMMVITSDGVKKAVGFRSLPQSEKWITAGWDGLKGLPWDVAPRAASAPRAIVGPGEVGPSPIVVVSPQPQAPRRMYVLKADVERLGATPGCPGCVSIAKHGRVLAGHAHNAVCSKRIFEALDAEEAGRERTGQYRERRQGQEARVRPAASAAAGTPPPKTARRITEPVAAAAAASAAPAATRSAAAPAAAATAARRRESQPVAPGFGVAAPSGGASSSSGAARAAEAAADVDMTAARSRLKRSAEVAPDDVPEALERGDPQPADVPVPVDMEDLAAQPAPAEGPQLPAGVAVVWNASEGRHMRVLALDVASIELVELGVLTRAKAELLPLVREQVSGQWASAGVDIADEEVDSIALSALQLGAVDVAEVYSPHRFSARAADFQLRPGFAADLEELKEDGAPWDLRRPEDVKELEKQQERMDPILLTGPPPCEKFSLLRGLSAKFRTDEQEAAEMEEARHHLKVAVDAYWRQLRKPGRNFLHEHPWSARSWNEDIVKEL
ncbi:unnamed protein product, partial [Prorocentrum cordatum]